MAEVSLDEKSKRLAGLIAQSPPGEVNDVINDIRAIVQDDEALMPHVLPHLREYNLSQLHPVQHPQEGGSAEHVSLLSHATVLPGTKSEDGKGKERYVDAEAKRSFAFDHVTLVVSDYEPYELPEEEGTFRDELSKSLSSYTKNHFASGYCAVSTSQFPLLPPQPVQPETSPETSVAPVKKDEPMKQTSKDSESDLTGKKDAEADTQSGEPTDTEPAERDIPGDAEPVPTPAIDDATLSEKKEDEVVVPETLEEVDEKVEEAKEDEEAAEATEVKEESSTTEKAESVTDEVEEGTLEKDEEAGAAEVPPAQTDTKGDAAPVEERKQERVENPTYTLEIVGNRYNPTNFWTGRWRTQWTVDQSAGTVEGLILVDVHYYEQGNVQLSTKHTASFPCPTEAAGSQSIASQIVTSISKLETEYHLELNDVYSELGEKAFRSLRRALPITRQKMDWEKVGGYTLGADLTKART